MDEDKYLEKNNKTKELIVYCKKNNKALVIRDLFFDIPKWDQFIQHINFEYYNPPQMVSNNPTVERMINGVCLMNNFYMWARDPNEIFYPQMKQLYSFFNLIFKQEGFPVGAYFNLIGKESPVQIHKDKRETIYWQCGGKTQWQIFDKNGTMNTYDLYPGDIIYIPQGLEHSVITNEPRTAIVIGYGE